MRNLRTRHFGHGCIFTSLIWTMLFFIYLNYIEVNLLLKNVPLKGTGPYQPFFTKFSSNFSNNSKQIRPQLKINKVENKSRQAEDIRNGCLKFDVRSSFIPTICQLPALSFVSTRKSFLPCFGQCTVSLIILHGISFMKSFW
uniref:Uncharacterized protein n=1 Tax=Vombatus ursinus TaxID=29139 RepID=A0A4X2KMI9_VOMUR